jgi:hypothetical protein
MKQYLSRFSLVLATFSTTALADEPLSRHGSVTETQQQIAVEGGISATLQHSFNSETENELLSSFDLVATLPAGAGEVLVYVEGSTSPRHNSVSSSNLKEANADAGSALDRDGHGRLQVSELHYTRPLGNNSLTLGLLNPAGSLDGSAVANDETLQFLGASFVNNPTIGMPDYTLGAVYHAEAVQARPGFTLVITSSHGLADNPDASYAELVDVSDDGKGAFLAGEIYGHQATATWRAGLWTNTAEHDYLDGSTDTGSNYGAYLSTDIDLSAYREQSRLNLRLGIANDKVSAAARFYGLSLETLLGGNTLGLGLAHTAVSARASNLADMTQAEIYLRLELTDSLHITPSVQWIENSGFTKSPDDEDNQASIVSIRAGYGF